MKNIARFTLASTAAACLAIAGASSASAEPEIPDPEPTLNVFAFNLGITKFAAVTNAEPGYVCKSEPEGTPFGDSDEYGQAIVSNAGFAAFMIDEDPVYEVTITCGPPHSHWTDEGTAPVIALS